MLALRTDCNLALATTKKPMRENAADGPQTAVGSYAGNEAFDQYRKTVTTLLAWRWHELCRRLDQVGEV